MDNAMVVESEIIVIQVQYEFVDVDAKSVIRILEN
jgi:hypothetical protein